MATNYEIAAARNPKWANPEKNMIDLEVDFAPLDEQWLQYTCSPTDVVEHSRTLYTKAVNGDYGTVADYNHHTLWTPYYTDSIEVSTEGLVQLLLEKGVITDDEVDVLSSLLE
jgi:hypothetical protein